MNEPRNVAIYLARKRYGLRLDEIGREFGLEKYSTVSSIVTRTEKQLSRDKQMRNRIGEIFEKIAKDLTPNQFNSLQEWKRETL